METFREVIEAWPGPTVLAADLGLSGSAAKRVDMWKRRGNIPPQYWQQIAESAKRRDIRISVQHLARLAASRRG